MSFPVGASLLDALVLAVVCNEDSYGYKITQEIRSVVDISESTLYPVLRRLQREHLLESYDKEYRGRNRRYYRATTAGHQQLRHYKVDWKRHSCSIEEILLGGAL